MLKKTKLATLAATAAACCLQCAGVANCAHFSWDGGAMACSLYSDRAGADGAAAAWDINGEACTASVERA